MGNIPVVQDSCCMVLFNKKRNLFPVKREWYARHVIKCKCQNIKEKGPLDEGLKSTLPEVMLNEIIIVR